MINLYAERERESKREKWKEYFQQPPPLNDIPILKPNLSRSLTETQSLIPNKQGKTAF